LEPKEGHKGAPNNCDAPRSNKGPEERGKKAEPQWTEKLNYHGEALIYGEEPEVEDVDG